ncbi:MAG: DegV family protein [Clostridia bacterium]|nr:DegV family protein [Clostridia bacterium]
MIWRIVSDSSCDLFDLPEACPDTEFATIPFIIRVGQTEYIDDEKISVDTMLTANENHREMAQTACPSPQAWVEEFSKPGNVLAFTISSNLSGSYNSACTARQMVQEGQPDKRIAVIDTKATGPETVLIIRKACELIRQGLAIDAIEKALNEAAAKTHIIFALSSYHNLMKAGRVNRLVGLLAGHLGFWGVGVGDDNGEIAMCGKARGPKNMVRVMLEEIKRIGLNGSGRAVISHCLNEQAAQQIKERLLLHHPGLHVDIIPTRGLDSFYAERHGLIVGF